MDDQMRVARPVTATRVSTAPAPDAPVLSVRGLRTSFYLRTGTVRAVDGVDLDAYAGRITAIVGGSGSGKSVMSRSIMRLVDEPGRIDAGSIMLNGRDLMGLSEREMCGVRGREVSMVFQEPTRSMDPIMTIRAHLHEALDAHGDRLPRAEETELFRATLRRVGFTDPDRILASYPFELSGGMCQRVMVALGVVSDPALLIADEPTSALDLTTQVAILDELLALRDEGMAIILITHDLGVVAQTADDMYVVHEGRVLEHGTVEEVFDHPRDPYTRYLMQPIDEEVRDER